MENPPLLRLPDPTVCWPDLNVIGQLINEINFIQLLLFSLSVSITSFSFSQNFVSSMRVCEWSGNCMELLNESGNGIDGVAAANEKKGSQKKKKHQKSSIEEEKLKSALRVNYGKHYLCAHESIKYIMALWLNKAKSDETSKIHIHYTNAYTISWLFTRVLSSSPSSCFG